MADDTPLLDVTEACHRLLAHFRILDPEEIPLGQSLGRILAADISAPFDLPPFDNSSMDGFAVQFRDIARANSENPVTLKVTADIPAGSSKKVMILEKQAARIMTGAPIPPGADSVVPVENTDSHRMSHQQHLPEYVKIFQPTGIGENIRRKGQDVQQGSKVLQAGIRIQPQEAGFVSMMGYSSMLVYRRPRVAVFSSGDELASPGTPLAPGKIYDANITMLSAQILKYGGEPIILGVAPDDPVQIQSILDSARQSKPDLILSSAGVSVGALDFVRRVVEEKGELAFWRVNMRPGKPIAFGSYQDIPFIGLPGNPVSAFVGFEVFVRPAILKMSGAWNINRIKNRVRLMENVESDGRESYLRASVSQENGELVARLTGHQGSGNLHSLVQANALLLIPSRVKSLPSGAWVDAWLFDDGT